MDTNITYQGRRYSLNHTDLRAVIRRVGKFLLIAVASIMASPLLAQEQPAEESRYALCGGTREACDPFSYLSNQYAIPVRGNYTAPVRSPLSNYTSPWAGYPGPWGYRGLPGYWGPPGFWASPGAWPVPVPFAGSQFRPGFPHVPLNGFSGFIGHPGGGFFFGFSTVPGTQFPIGVQPFPQQVFHHGFSTGEPMTSPGFDRPSGATGFGGKPFPSGHAPVMRHR